MPVVLLGAFGEGKSIQLLLVSIWDSFLWRNPQGPLFQAELDTGPTGCFRQGIGIPDAFGTSITFNSTFSCWLCCR
jgi:hypothetical protein